MKLQLPSENSNNINSLAKIKRSQLLFVLAFFFVGFSYAQTTVVCADGPINDTYCYGNFDTTAFEYTSDTGFPLVLTFNAGTTEVSFDEVIVLDSDGVTNLNAGAPYGAGGQLAGLTFQSSGDTITLMIDSDVSVSCQSGSQTEWDWDVFCQTCNPPTIDFVSNNMCFTGQDFEIDVNVTDLGSTGTMTITDNQGSAPVVVTATGTTTFGPYDPNMDVIFTVDNGDANCLIISDPISCECVPPTVDFVSNDMCFPGQMWNIDVVITDLGGASSLTIFDTNGSPNQTAMAPGTFTFGPYAPGTVVNIIVDGGVTDCIVPSGPIACDCVPPTVDFVSNDMCFPGQMWNIDVVITDLGGAASLNIFDTAGSPNQTATAPGTFTFGPYDPNTIVNIIVDGGVPDCIVPSGPIDCECVPPTATFTQDGMCDVGEEFSVLVDITDLGGASTLTITDDQGNPAQIATAPGMFTFGTYAPGVTPIITIDGGATDCVIDSGVINCVSSGSCDILSAGDDAFLDCDTTCIDLNGTFLTTPSLATTSYAIQGPICDLPPLTGGSFTTIDADDEWSDSVPLTFDFNFFGNTYSDIVVSGNGVVSFNTALNGFHTWVMDPGQMIPMNTPGLVANSIFGAYHDIDPGDVPNNINYFVTGTAPYRIFVINFNEIPQFSCTTLITTQQILLYESLNVIDVNIVNKDVCPGWNDGLAVLGIQGTDLTQFSVPEDRNVGVWTAQNESWRFVPSGAPTNASTFEWRDAAGTVLSNDPIFEVCPTETTTYTAALVVELPGGGFDEITDDVTITKEAGCATFDCTETLLFEDFGTGTGFETHPFTNLDFNDGTVQIEGNEYTVTSISDNLNTGWHVGMEDHTIGDTNGQMIFFNPSVDPAEFELYRRDVTVTANTQNSFSFWMSTVYDIDTNICPAGGDPTRLVYRVEDAAGNIIATENTGEVPNQSDPEWINFSLAFDSGNNTQVQIVILNDITGGCGNDLAVDDIAVFTEGTPPAIIAPTDLEACDETGNEEATFDLTSTITELLDGLDPALHVITFHNNQVDADSGDNDIATPAAYVNTTNPETIFVRVEKINQPNCYSTVSFMLNITDAIVITTGLPAQVEFCDGDAFTPLDATPTNSGIDLTTVTYSWMDASGAIVSTDALFTPTMSGTYTVTITVPPCSTLTVTVEVNVNPVPDLDLGPDTTVCDGEDYEIVPTIVGDTTNASYLWSTGETTPIITVSTSGTYSLTLTTDDGCIVTDEVVVVISDPVTAFIEINGELVSDTDDFETCPEFVNTLVATASVDGVTYQWFLNDVLLDGETSNTIEVSLPANTMGTQTYSVVVDNNGCMGMTSVDLSLYTDNANCVISQGISANGDGINDTLDLSFLNARTGIESIQIFNRLGREVYVFGQGYTNQWEGQTTDGEELPTGTYFMVLKMSQPDPVFEQTYSHWIYINREAN